jgi:hypothetical protein
MAQIAAERASTFACFAPRSILAERRAIKVLLRP